MTAVSVVHTSIQRSYLYMFCVSIVLRYEFDMFLFVVVVVFTVTAVHISHLELRTESLLLLLLLYRIANEKRICVHNINRDFYHCMFLSIDIAFHPFLMGMVFLWML